MVRSVLDSLRLHFMSEQRYNQGSRSGTRQAVTSGTQTAVGSFLLIRTGCTTVVRFLEMIGHHTTLTW
eukprot:COSAG01_NODE_22288_length_862_cov_1.440367_1_plen_68_part_00